MEGLKCFFCDYLTFFLYDIRRYREVIIWYKRNRWGWPYLSALLIHSVLMGQQRSPTLTCTCILPPTHNPTTLQINMAPYYELPFDLLVVSGYTLCLIFFKKGLYCLGDTTLLLVQWQVSRGGVRELKTRHLNTDLCQRWQRMWGIGVGN